MLERNLGCKPRLSSCLSTTSFSPSHTFFCVCVTYVVPLSLSVSVYFSVSLLSPLVSFMIFFSSSNYLAITNSSSVYSRDPLDQYICLLEFMWVIRRVDSYISILIHVDIEFVNLWKIYRSLNFEKKIIFIKLFYYVYCILNNFLLYLRIRYKLILYTK